MDVIGVLGMTELAPRVRAAFADQRIPPDLAGEKDFNRLLDDAAACPDDPARLAAEGMGTIEDVLVELEAYPAWNDPDDEVTDEDLLEWAAEGLSAEDFAAEDLPWRPVHNPYRDVGRNDPCPCGSGKKFKKCCLGRAE